jgi:hypothetical protein
MSTLVRIVAVLPLRLACASATPSELQDCVALAELSKLPEASCLGQENTAGSKGPKVASCTVTGSETWATDAPEPSAG